MPDKVSKWVMRDHGWHELVCSAGVFKAEKMTTMWYLTYCPYDKPQRFVTVSHTLRQAKAWIALRFLAAGLEDNHLRAIDRKARIHLKEISK